jgi:hypothetical protein
MLQLRPSNALSAAAARPRCSGTNVRIAAVSSLKSGDSLPDLEEPPAVVHDKKLAVHPFGE